MMNDTKKYQILDGTMLKMIALVSMLVDHVGDMFFPEVMWMRMIGRLAMPLFSFCIAEGYAHTRNPKKYLMRMGIFALVSEIPFDLAFGGKIGLDHQNIMFTFLLSIIAIMLFDKILGEKNPQTDKYSIYRAVIAILSVALISILSLITKADYTVFAVLGVFLFYVLRHKHHLVRCGIGVAFLAMTRTMGYYSATGFSIIPLALYNGKRGKGMKWLFYAFYPGHLLLLYILKKVLGVS